MAVTKRRPVSTRPRRGYSAPALEKGIDIVELLANAESGLTVSEIAQRLKRRMSELFRIIIVMEHRHWLQKDPETSRYSVTYHVLQLAHRGTPAQSLTLAAAPVMYELSTRINQSCHLVVRSGKLGLVILRQENQERYANLSVRLGAVMKLVSSCSGQMLLAYMEPEEREKLLRSLTPAPGISRAKLDKILHGIGQRGFQVQKSSMTAGVTDISYPIHGFDGKVVAVLTVPYLHVFDDSLPTTVEQTRRLLEQSTRRISHALGWIR
jgi:DNA-binding IclR family transcriptional regulator